MTARTSGRKRSENRHIGMSPCSREQRPRGPSDNLMSEVYYLGFRLVKIWVNLHFLEFVGGP